MRFSKRVGNQYWQVTSLFEGHGCHKTSHNRQAKNEWLANKFAHILRHNLKSNHLYLWLNQLTDGV